jgi:pimeloyl-ACP methyl ester carboxylesterase
MEILRTPDDRFSSLADWSHRPRYTDVAIGDGSDRTLRVHHVDVGPSAASETILCMHGEPTWGYLYRKMIPVFVEAGHRVVVPDLVGFGRSDKPAATTDYTYERQVAWMNEWLVKNDLRGLTLVCQDWGGLIGLRLVAAQPDRFSRVVIANTGLPTGDPGPNEAFLAWRKFSQTVPVFETSKIIQGGCSSKPLQVGPAHLSVARADQPRRSVERAQPGGLGVPRDMDQTVRVHVQRSGSGDAQRRMGLPQGGSRQRGHAAHHDRGRWSLPAGGSRPGVRRCHQFVRRRDVLTDRQQPARMPASASCSA